MKRTTIKDVAREAGVSISTVSNALINVGVISEKTRAHVLEVADRLHYIPNSSGQNLRSQERRAIGLFVYELVGAYYAVLAESMHRECVKRGYELYIYITSSDETILQKTLGGEVSGAVLFCNVSERTVHMLDSAGIPVILLNIDRCAKNVSSVVFDSFHEGEMAANYLMGLGHRRLMHVAGIPDNYDAVSREAGMRSAMERAGLAIEEGYRIEGLFSRRAAYRAMKQFLVSGKPLPDAIFAANDLSAYGCMEAMKEEGIRVPEDVSLIGCDDIEICEICTPPLTTIRTNFDVQGIIALGYLLDIMDGEHSGTVHYIGGQLVIRGSCREKE